MFEDELDAPFDAAADAALAKDMADEARPHAAWWERMRAAAQAEGMPVQKYLRDKSHVEDSTRASYVKAMQHFQALTLAGMYPGRDMLSLTIDELAAAVDLHMTGLVSMSTTGRFKSTIETFSASMNFALEAAGCAARRLRSRASSTPRWRSSSCRPSLATRASTRRA
jgi:hypothetical protein